MHTSFMACNGNDRRISSTNDSSEVWKAEKKSCQCPASGHIKKVPYNRELTERSIVKVTSKTIQILYFRKY